MAGKKKIIIIFSALGLFLFLGILLFQETRDESPEQAYRNYIAAQNEGNCEEVVNYYSDELLKEIGQDRESSLEECREFIGADNESVIDNIESIEVTSMDDESTVLNVTVASTFANNGGEEETTEETYEITLINEQGSWRIYQ